MEMQANRNTEVSQDELSLKELIQKIRDWTQYLLSKWLILLAVSMFGACLGFLYAYSKKPVYMATTTFVLEAGDQGGGGGLAQYAGMAAMIGIDIGGGKEGLFQGENILELYKSRKMIEAALLKPSISDSSMLLIDYYLLLNGVRNKWKEKNSQLINIDFRNDGQKELQRLKDSIIQGAVRDINKGYLTVGKVDKKLSIIKVDVKSNDETFSKEFNEALVEGVNEFYIQTKTKKSLDNIKILEEKTDSVRAVMNSNINAVASIIDATPNLNPTRQSQRVGPTQRSQFSAETNKAILSHLVQNLELSKMALMKETPLIQVVDDPVYPLTVDRFGKSKGFVLGGILAWLLIVIILVVKRVVSLHLP